MFKTQKCFVAVRMDEWGEEWLDLNTISGILKISEINAQQVDEKCGPQWVEANPVVRYAKIEIKEVE